MEWFFNVDISQSVTMCVTMAVIFLILALIFEIKKEKATILVAGFNGLPKMERETYDNLKISLHYRNLFLLWVLIYLVAMVLCLFVLPQFVCVAYIIWIISFAQNTHLDPRTAFDKYKLDE